MPQWDMQGHTSRQMAVISSTGSTIGGKLTTWSSTTARTLPSAASSASRSRSATSVGCIAQSMSVCSSATAAPAACATRPTAVLMELCAHDMTSTESPGPSCRERSTVVMPAVAFETGTQSTGRACSRPAAAATARMSAGTASSSMNRDGDASTAARHSSAACRATRSVAP